MKLTKTYREQPLVILDSVSKAFGERVILKGLSLELYEEENLVILGKSGAGKSVLIKCLVGLIRPDSGKITVLGKDITQLSEEELNAMRLQIGFSFQGSALYDSMTIFENLAFPLRRAHAGIRESEITKRVTEKLEEVGLPHTRDQLPAELSGGMKKRIGIARTLILNPKIMLYDEPTAGLDPETASDINDLIVQVKKTHKTSAIIITHDLSCAHDTGDRIIGLFDGYNKIEGTYESLKNNPPAELASFFNYLEN
jgi:phospholipid/cholesterol/gamma-HCH transport system ATP-binding protein